MPLVICIVSRLAVGRVKCVSNVHLCHVATVPAGLRLLRNEVLERQKRSEFEFGVVDQVLRSAVSLATAHCVLLPAD